MRMLRRWWQWLRCALGMHAWRDASEWRREPRDGVWFLARRVVCRDCSAAASQIGAGAWLVSAHPGAQSRLRHGNPGQWEGR